MKLAVFEKALGDFRGELEDFDPALVTSGDAARAFAVFTDLEKTISAAKTLVASRATEAGDWKKEGHRSPASWVAEKTGSGFGEATSYSSPPNASSHCRRRPTRCGGASCPGRR
jgi:hypothetical protein